MGVTAQGVLICVPSCLSSTSKLMAGSLKTEIWLYLFEASLSVILYWINSKRYDAFPSPEDYDKFSVWHGLCLTWAKELKSISSFKLKPFILAFGSVLYIYPSLKPHLTLSQLPATLNPLPRVSGALTLFQGSPGRGNHSIDQVTRRDLGLTVLNLSKGAYSSEEDAWRGLCLVQRSESLMV